MKPRTALSLPLAALMLLAALSAPGCRKATTDEDAPPAEAASKVMLAVRAARVTIKAMSQKIAVPGVTAALSTLILRAPTAGRVVGLAVTPDDFVQRGQVIGHIINREEDAAEAGVEAAQKIDPAEAASLGRSVRRYADAPGVAVRVPQNAVVTQRVVSPGQIVNEFDPLVDLVDPASVYVEAQAPINQLGALKAGMDATVTSALKPGIVYPARIWSLSPSFSAGGTTSPVRVRFAGPERISQIGASVEVHITTRSVTDAIVIPAEALFEDAERNNSYVFAVGGDNRAHRVVIATGIRTPTEVQVTQGLKPGDLVITSGGYALSDGLQVRATVTPAAGVTPVAEPSTQGP